MQNIMIDKRRGSCERGSRMEEPKLQGGLGSVLEHRVEGSKSGFRRQENGKG